MKYCFKICFIWSVRQEFYILISPAMDKSLCIDKELEVLPTNIQQLDQYHLCIIRDFCVFCNDWSLFSGKTIYSSFSDNYTYGICILIKKAVIMSDSYKQKFIIRTLLISLRCSLSFLPGFLNSKIQLNYVLSGVNFCHHLSLKVI